MPRGKKKEDIYNKKEETIENTLNVENDIEISEVKTNIETTEKVLELKKELSKKKEAKIEKIDVVVPVIKTLSKKEWFKNEIEKTPYTIYQNGVLVACYDSVINIKYTETYFEVHKKKYSYLGLEFKH